MGNYPPKFYFRLFKLHLKINGLRWTLYFSIRHFLVELLRFIEKRTRRLEKKYDLPGSNSVMENALKWNHYRWARGEDEWNQSIEWKTSVIEDVMLKNILPDRVVLEIGPGYGRWTRKLIEISDRLIVVDVTDKCITHCIDEFGDNTNVEFHVNDGRSLPFISDRSVDFVWSFDVFVHIEPPDIECYLQEFRRILKPGGLVIIHHGVIGKTDFGWRSSLTLQVFSDLLEKHDFTLVEQFNSWGENNEYALAGSDMISIFKRA
ncbi:MAG: class I SAM-dependent methyltransferase [Gammaproteobacteria bacterium]|nr:class I SAM-dependent methyltransferase [Gammaproteobacteria bacterium]MDH3430059.1 class I SAM-dependent methyltransferase [Gammaproteobacteria bacterium]